MSTAVIKAILSQYRQWKAGHAVALSLYKRSNADDAQALRKKKVAMVQSWLSILSDEQRFVVTKHLLDRLPWPYVVIEYEKRWGAKVGKAERTLKRYQSQALHKIAAFIDNSEHKCDVARLFDLE
jgi:hypothetical protein